MAPLVHLVPEVVDVPGEHLALRVADDRGPAVRAASPAVDHILSGLECVHLLGGGHDTGRWTPARYPPQLLDHMPRQHRWGAAGDISAEVTECPSDSDGDRLVQIPGLGERRLVAHSVDLSVMSVSGWISPIT